MKQELAEACVEDIREEAVTPTLVSRATVLIGGGGAAFESNVTATTPSSTVAMSNE